MEGFSHPDDSWAWLIAGIGVSLGLVMVGEGFLLLAGVHHFPDAYFVGVFTSSLAVAGLVYGGYWTATSALSGERYRRIAGWCFGGGFVFLAVNFLVMLSIPPEALLHAVGWARWAFGLGAVAGLLVGVFEARAIERAQSAERLRVKKRETERRNDLLDEFASLVSHDLRNPLNVAQGRLELAQEEVDSRHLDDVERALDRMDTIIDETLLLAREGRAVGETEAVPLESVVTSCWSTVDTENAELVVETLPTVEADPSRLQHVFENLFRNAVEHGSASRDSQASRDAVEHGGENVRIRVGTLPDATGFFVEDDGPGIPSDQVEDVFEPGYTTSSQGSGFGLGIVARIVQAHGWDIRVTTGAEGGARFEITGVDVVENPHFGRQSEPAIR